MKLTENLKNLWFRSRKSLRILLCASTVILLVLICYSCIRAGAQKDKAGAGNLPLSEESRDMKKQDGAASSGAASDTELPDLAETIARLSRQISDPDREAFIEDFWRWIFGEANLPERLARQVASSALEGPAFIMELLGILHQDPYTYRLVDKQHGLPLDYEPADLVRLREGIYRLGRNDLALRRIAADALDRMAAAAAAEGVFFTAGSAYRSAAYQAQVYDREVKIYGQEAADRESAQPGKSQHQLGLIIDFSPIDDAFAKTPASQWLQHNAGRYGWSLSFPEGYEEVTGYRWESWHYRYVGPDLAAFIDTYFDGIQQYALQFIQAWLEQAKN